MNKEIYIDLSWLSTKFSGGAFYSVTNIIKCIFENKKILKNYKIFIIARKKFFTENKLPNKVKKISISNIYYFNFLIRWFFLIYFSKKGVNQIYFCPNIYSVIIRGNFKIINMFHDNQWKFFPNNFSYIKLIWIKINIFLCEIISDEIICTSNFIRKQFMKKNLRKKLKSIYIPFKKNKKYSKLNFKKRKFIFMLSSMLKHKNLSIIKDLFLSKSFKLNIKDLVIAGLGGHKKIELIKDKKITFLGSISENQKNWLFKNCYLFIQPSRYEGFGMTVIEALLNKKKILCSNLDVLLEVGSSFPIYVKDSNSIKKWNDGLIRARKTKFNSQKINKHLNKFNYKTISNKYYELFNEIK